MFENINAAENDVFLIVVLPILMNYTMVVIRGYVLRHRRGTY